MAACVRGTEMAPPSQSKRETEAQIQKVHKVLGAPLRPPSPEESFRSVRSAESALSPTLPHVSSRRCFNRLSSVGPRVLSNDSVSERRIFCAGFEFVTTWISCGRCSLDRYLKGVRRYGDELNVSPKSQARVV
ncbi:hypothetical protein MRX96_027108 [Rhipicephalus microplus]